MIIVKLIVLSLAVIALTVLRDVLTNPNQRVDPKKYDYTVPAPRRGEKVWAPNTVRDTEKQTPNRIPVRRHAKR